MRKMKSLYNYFINHPNTASFLAIGIYFAILFLQWPLNHSLSGNADTWLNLSNFYYYMDWIRAFLQGESISYQALYPAGPAFLYGETSFFTAFLFAFITIFVENDIWAWYILMVLLYSMNGWAFYLLSEELFQKALPAFFCGMLLASSNYLLAQSDQQNVVSVYPAILSVWLIIKYVKTDRFIFIVWSALLAAIQIYCSGYHFVLLAFSLIVLMVFYLVEHFERKHLVSVGVWMSILLFSITPYLYISIFSGVLSGAFNPLSAAQIADVSLSWESLQTSLANNILYGDGIHKADLQTYMLTTHPGFLLVAFAFAGMFLGRFSNLEKACFCLMVLGIFLALGPAVQSQIPILGNLLENANKASGFYDFFRIPVRAFMIILLVLILLAGKVFIRLIAAEGMGKPAAFVLFAILLLEQTPYKLHGFENERFLIPPDALVQRSKWIAEDSSLLILPSRIFHSIDGSAGLNGFSREYVYMYWQTKYLKCNLANGANGYIPKQRMALDSILHGTGSIDDLSKLQSIFGIAHSIVIPSMLFSDEAANSSLIIAE